MSSWINKTLICSIQFYSALILSDFLKKEIEKQCG